MTRAALGHGRARPTELNRTELTEVVIARRPPAPLAPAPPPAAPPCARVRHPTRQSTTSRPRPTIKLSRQENGKDRASAHHSGQAPQVETGEYDHASYTQFWVLVPYVVSKFWPTFFHIQSWLNVCPVFVQFTTLFCPHITFVVGFTTSIVLFQSTFGPYCCLCSPMSLVLIFDQDSWQIGQDI